MRIMAAMDSFKGSLTSVEAAEAVRRGILSACPDAEVLTLPIADGGEGTVDAYVAACGGGRVTVRVHDPLGREIDAAYAKVGKTAVLEMAAASGLTLVEPEQRDPRVTSTYGTGELIRAALDAGLRDIILGLGGSATNDGGAGMLRALGVRFLDAAGRELPDGGEALGSLDRVDISKLDARLKKCRIRAACDVDNPLLGKRGASAVFSPQKGASPDTVEVLDRALQVYADVTEIALGRSAREYPGAGAAGGMGFALRLFLSAELTPGVALLLDTSGFDRLVRDCDAVITGEGATDYQTAYGKAPVGVAARAGGRPVYILSGSLGRGYEAVYDHGVTAAFSIITRPMTLDAAIRDAAPLLEAAADRLGRVLTRTLQAGVR